MQNGKRREASGTHFPWISRGSSQKQLTSQVLHLHRLQEEGERPAAKLGNPWVRRSQICPSVASLHRVLLVIYLIYSTRQISCINVEIRRKLRWKNLHAMWTLNSEFLWSFSICFMPWLATRCAMRLRSMLFLLPILNDWIPIAQISVCIKLTLMTSIMSWYSGFSTSGVNWICRKSKRRRTPEYKKARETTKVRWDLSRTFWYSVKCQLEKENVSSSSALHPWRGILLLSLGEHMMVLLSCYSVTCLIFALHQGTPCLPGTNLPVR